MEGRSTVGIEYGGHEYCPLTLYGKQPRTKGCHVVSTKTIQVSDRPTNLSILLEVEFTQETNPVRRMLADLCERAEEPLDRK